MAFPLSATYTSSFPERATTPKLGKVKGVEERKGRESTGGGTTAKIQTPTTSPRTIADHTRRGIFAMDFKAREK